MPNESERQAALSNAYRRLTAAALLDLADSPTTPLSFERTRAEKALLGEVALTELGAQQIRLVHRQAISCAVFRYAQLCRAVEECFEISQEES